MQALPHTPKGKRRLYILCIILFLSICIAIISNAGNIGRYFYEKAVDNWGETGYKMAIPFLELEYLKTKDIDMLYRLCVTNPGFQDNTKKAERFMRCFERYDEAVQEKDNNYWDMYMVYIATLGMNGKGDKLLSLYERDREIAPVRAMVIFHNSLMGVGKEDVVISTWTRIVDSPAYTDCKNMYIVSYVSISFGSLLSYLDDDDSVDEAYLAELKERHTAYIIKIADWLGEWIDKDPTAEILLHDTHPVSHHLELGESEVYAWSSHKD